MTESDWRRLLRQIRDGYVVPVIGPQLLAGADGASTVQRVLAERLLELHGVPAAERPVLRPFRELNAAVSHLLGSRTAKAQALYVDVADLMDELARDPLNLPLPLRQLAEISDFRLFVSMTCDGLMASALRTLRGPHQVGEVVHAPKLPTNEWRDLPENWSGQGGDQAWVLYMFGRARPAPVYAIHDEDVLEYAHNVMARGGNVPLHFLRALQDRSLLMLGCGLPDWLGRFFLRLTNKDRLSEKTRHEWLVEAPRGARADDELASFLKYFSEDTECLELQSPTAFVDELHRRWLAERQPAPGVPAVPPVAVPVPEVPHGAVFFVSYSRVTDAAAAQQLVEALRGLGCGDGEIWFDRGAIEPGEDFAREIMGGVASCRYFLPLLSQAALQREEAFVFREWRAAREREGGLNRAFVVPLVVDVAYDPARYAGAVADWGHLHFGHAPGGVPDGATLHQLKQLLRDARNPARAAA